MVAVSPSPTTEPSKSKRAKSEKQSLAINLIRIDGGTQSRAALDDDVIAEYAQAMTDGAQFPPVVVFYDGKDYWLADGFHRHAAVIKTTRRHNIWAIIRQGTQRDAVLYSVGVNADHGLQRSNPDKRRAVTTLLSDSEWSKWSDNEIARRCRVSKWLVADIRKPLTGRSSSEVEFTTRHGTPAVMSVGAIREANAQRASAGDPAPITPPAEMVVVYANGLVGSTRHFAKRGEENTACNLYRVKNLSETPLPSVAPDLCKFCGQIMGILGSETKGTADDLEAIEDNKIYVVGRADSVPGVTEKRILIFAGPYADFHNAEKWLREHPNAGNRIKLWCASSVMIKGYPLPYSFKRDVPAEQPTSPASDLIPMWGTQRHFVRPGEDKTLCGKELRYLKDKLNSYNVYAPCNACNQAAGLPFVAPAAIAPNGMGVAVSVYASGTGYTRHLVWSGQGDTLCNQPMTHLLREPKTLPPGVEYRLCPKCGKNAGLLDAEGNPIHIEQPAAAPTSTPAPLTTEDGVILKYQPSDRAMCNQCNDWRHFIQILPGGDLWQCKECGRQMRDDTMLIWTPVEAAARAERNASWPRSARSTLGPTKPAATDPAPAPASVFVPGSGKLEAPAPSLPKYSVILADPPWQYEKYAEASDEGRTAESHYPTMALDDICALPVGSLAADNCALLMWVTWPLMDKVFAVAAAWGFQYKTAAFVWAKTNKNAAERMSIVSSDSNWFFGMGSWTRANSEACLLFTRGQPQRLAADVRQLIVTPISDHSRKPDAQYGRIERLFAGPYVELFARQKRPNWSAWGNEIKSDFVLPLAVAL